ncbi:MAG TPA: ATP-binding protein [Anaeromyxobacteraceae bacterium]|nr:ATP-binding protein [Anaeromyxobacteraceae bacterium]
MAEPDLGAPPRAPAGAAEAGLQRKLVWLTLFRLVTITVLLAGIAVTTWQAGQEMGAAAAPLYGIILFTYAASIVSALLLRGGRGLTALAFGQIGLDVALAAAVVAVTGRSESVFVFLFSIAVVNGAILLFARGAAVAVVGAVAVYLALVLGAPGPRPASLATVLFAHGAAFLATGALASYLAGQLRRAGERLAESESDLAFVTALHESIVQSVSSGLVTLDGAGRITFLNRAAEHMTGWRLEEVRGRPAGTRLDAFATGGRRGEADFESARGQRLRLGYTRFPLMGRDGREMGSAVIFQDLTEMRAMEERVRRSEQLAEMGRVAAGLAHELRNPLASVTGSVELLKGGGGLAGEERRLLDIVLREAERLDQLVTRFLEWSRPAPLRREATDLARLLEETLTVFRNDPAAARVLLEADLRPAAVACDPDQMRQVFWNLLANAAQAMDGSGGRIRVSCDAGAGGVRVEVADDGPGIDPSDLHRLFEPFFTTKRDGTGLGLATVQRIVDAHGGTVAVESAPGRGAAFTVRLPASSAAPQES